MLNCCWTWYIYNNNTVVSKKFCNSRQCSGPIKYPSRSFKFPSNNMKVFVLIWNQRILSTFVISKQRPCNVRFFVMSCTSCNLYLTENNKVEQHNNSNMCFPYCSTTTKTIITMQNRLWLMKCVLLLSLFSLCIWIK